MEQSFTSIEKEIFQIIFIILESGWSLGVLFPESESSRICYSSDIVKMQPYEVTRIEIVYSAFWVCGFYIHGFNQSQSENIQKGKNKNSKKFQKGKSKSNTLATISIAFTLY